MERLTQFVSDSFHSETSQLEHSPPHHLPVTSSSSSSSSVAVSAAGTSSPAQNIDVETVDEDGTRRPAAAQLSHGIRHIILLQQPPMKPAVAAPHRRPHPAVVSIVCFISANIYIFIRHERQQQIIQNRKKLN